jgi:hypothetical protein
MAHYIAELIQDAEKAGPEERPAKMRACYDAIINLWEHRYTLTDGKRPFEELEPLLRTLKSLDPEDDAPRYFRSVRSVADDADENDETKSLLRLIDHLDHSARILIRFCLTLAAQSALDQSMEWVSLAQAAGVDEGPEFPLVQAIFEEDRMLKTSDPSEEEKKCIEDRTNRLESFARVAMEVASDLRKKVQQTKGIGDES